MSGRYNIPYLVGDTKGRDHVMWPIVSPTLFSSVLAGGPTGNISEPYWGGRRLSLDQLMAVAWRVSEWQFSGGWGIVDAVYIEPGHIYVGNVSCDNVFVNSPLAKAYFARVQNDLATFHMPIVNEKELVFESFGPAKFTSSRQYHHDFPNYPLHNFGIRWEHMDQNSTIDDGAGTHFTVSGGTFDTRMFRDYESNAAFNQSRGSDMVRFHEEGDGPTGPSGTPSPPSFDIRLNIVGINAGSSVYCVLDTTSASPNAVVTFDPVIAPTFTVPCQIIAASNNPGSSHEYVSHHCNVLITATKFFEYSNRDGDPIFDEATGALTGNDPFA